MSAPTKEFAPWKDFMSALPWLVPAVVVRLWIQLSGRCVLDSDEGVIGIQMMEALRGEFRAFYHGQDYLGTLPWLVGSPGLLLFGANPNSLRIIYIVYLVVVLLLWRGILKRLGAAGAWPWVAIIVGISPAFMAEYTLRARGTVEGLIVGSAWLWVTVRIISDSRSFEEMRGWIFALGLATGAAWWSTQLSIFFLVPGAVLFFSDRRVLGELRAFVTRPFAAVWIAAFCLTAIVFLRASLSYRSPFQEILWGARESLLLAWLLGIMALVALAARGSLPRWSVLGLLGLSVGYLPALAAVWSKWELYNTTSLQPLHSWVGNLFSFLLMGSLDLIGIGSERSEWGIVSAAAAIFAASVFITAVVLLLLSVADSLRSGQKVERIDLLLLVAVGWSIPFYCVAAPSSLPLGHYGTFVGFFLLLVVGVFLWRLSLINRGAALGATAVLVVIHGASLLQMPRTHIDVWSGVERDDAAAIEFLLDRDIHVAATSFVGSSLGYWEAYRLTFSAGERLRVHPVLHMPRIDRYRVELREATRTAIVTISPEMVTTTLESEGIEFLSEQFGRLHVIHSFDKGAVDRLELLSYKRRLDE